MTIADVLPARNSSKNYDNIADIFELANLRPMSAAETLTNPMRQKSHDGLFESRSHDPVAQSDDKNMNKIADMPKTQSHSFVARTTENASNADILNFDNATNVSANPEYKNGQKLPTPIKKHKIDKCQFAKNGIFDDSPVAETCQSIQTPIAHLTVAATHTSAQDVANNIYSAAEGASKQNSLKFRNLGGQKLHTKENKLVPNSKKFDNDSYTQ